MTPDASTQPEPPVELTYGPLDTVPSTRTHQRAKPTVGHRICLCDKLLPNAGIIDGEVLWSDIDQCHQRSRRIYCDHCQAFICWFELCDAAGNFYGIPLATPATVRDPKTVARWLAEHPKAAGVEDVA